jgi:hypothetical protein
MNDALSSVFTFHLSQVNTHGFEVTEYKSNFTLTLPRIIINFFLITNQTHYFSNLFRYKTLHVSGIFSTHHQEFSTVHSSLVSFLQVW